MKRKLDESNYGKEIEDHITPLRLYELRCDECKKVYEITLPTFNESHVARVYALHVFPELGFKVVEDDDGFTIKCPDCADRCSASINRSTKERVRLKT